MALSRLSPKNKKIIDWEKNYLIQGSGKLEEIRLCLQIVGKLIEGNPKHSDFFGDDDPDKEYRLTFSKQILAKIFATDMGFFSRTYGIDDDRDLSIALGEDPHTFYGIDHELLFGRPFYAVRSLMADYAKNNNIKALAQVVKKITVKDGKKNIAIV